MNRAAAAYTALHNGMATTSPSCADDARFVDDTTEPAEVEHVCMLCPLFELCTAYAQIARPTGGIWAGRRWNRTERKGK